MNLQTIIIEKTVIKLPDGSYINLPSDIIETRSLIKWLKKSPEGAALGKYEIAFLVDKEFDVLMNAVVHYSKGKWGVCRITGIKESTLINTAIASKDLKMFLDHLTSKIPPGTTKINLLAADLGCLPLGYEGKKGFTLYFESSSGYYPASLDIFWEVSDYMDSIFWDLPFIKEDEPYFRDTTIIAPGFSEAFAIVESIRSRLNVLLYMNFTHLLKWS